MPLKKDETLQKFGRFAGGQHKMNKMVCKLLLIAKTLRKSETKDFFLLWWGLRTNKRKHAKMTNLKIIKLLPKI